MKPRTALWGAVGAAALATVLGVLSAWPVYETAWLIVVAVVGLVLGSGLGILVSRRSRRWPVPLTVVAVAATFALSVVPVAMPGSATRATLGPVEAIGPLLLSAWGDGLAAVVLGWKQLLTLTLPVGTYQTVLVPAYLVFFLSAFSVVAARHSRRAALAAVALLAPVLFGTVFGAGELSPTLRLPGIGAVPGPRELSLWLVAAALGAAWIAWATGAERRRVIRHSIPGRRGAGGIRAVKGALSLGVVAIAVIVGLVVAPTLSPDQRDVPRDRVAPDVTLADQPSPLASYRAFKQNDALDEPLFRVTADGELPKRLRIAVLDAYDGVDFHVSAGATKAGAAFGAVDPGRFTRFPSAGGVSDPVEVTVRIESGYSEIWMPIAPLGSVPVFSGDRAEALTDALYVNRATGSAIVVPSTSGGDGQGLRDGDEYRARMSRAPARELTGRPAVDGAQFDLEAMPELAEWVRAQQQPATADGLRELIERLRARGYLSHSLSNVDGGLTWLTRLSERYGTRFWPSAGGQSVARIEQLFGQLNAQQRRMAAANAAETDSESLIAAVGDDEQFAAAGALLARALGFDSRIVLGVRLEGADPVPGVPNCAGECTGENLAAWIEVRGENSEWAAIDVTPQLERLPSTLSEGERLPEYPTAPEERDAQEVDPPVGIGDPDRNSADPDADSAAAWFWPALRALGLSVLALLCLAIPLLFLPVAKHWRARRRRREPDPELRIMGAWQEVLDACADGLLDHVEALRGDKIVRLAARSTRRETAAVIGTALDGLRPGLGERLWQLATMVDRAVFSAERVTDADADAVWRQADGIRRKLGALATPWGRTRARYSLRSYGIGFAVKRRNGEESRQRNDAMSTVSGQRSSHRSGRRHS